MRRTTTFVAAGLIGIGGYWAISASSLGIWREGQPGTGFLPLVYGLMLVVFAGFALFSPAISEEDSAGVLKPLGILALTIIAVVGLDVVGAVASLFLLMFCLFVFVERLPFMKAAIVAAGVVTILFLIFRVWLNVQLPRGILGW